MYAFPLSSIDNKQVCSHREKVARRKGRVLFGNKLISGAQAHTARCQKRLRSVLEFPPTVHDEGRDMEREGAQKERNKGEKESADATSPRLTSRSRDVSVYMCIRMCVCVQARIAARGKESKATEFCLFPVSGPPGSYGVSRGGQYLHITSSWRGDHRR